MNADWSIVTGDPEDSFYQSNDCCSYALHTNAGIVLFDSGAGIKPSATLRKLESVGARPSILCLTHAHADHAGGAAIIKAAFSTRIYAGSKTSEWLARGSDADISLDIAKSIGLYPPDYTFHTCSADRILADGEQWEFGGAVITSVATPGHSSDHFSYLVTFNGLTTLIAGDALFADGSILLQDTWDCSLRDACASVRKLSEYEFQALAPGHGSQLTANAKEAANKAMARIQSHLPPPNFF